MALQHTVNLIPCSQIQALHWTGLRSTGVRHLLPLGERSSTKHPIVSGSDQVPTDPEVFADNRMDCKEALSLAG